MNVIAIRQPTGEMNLPPEEGGELGTFSLKWVFAFLVRRWMLIATVGAVVFALAFAAFMTQPPQYSATTLITINPGQERVLLPEQMVGGGEGNAPTTTVLDTQLEVLRSNMLAGRLVDALNLANDPQWNVGLDDPDAPLAGDQSPAAAAHRAQVRQDVIKAATEAISVRRPGL